MSDLNLYAASNQWAVRPADQRFWTLAQAHAHCQGYAFQAAELTADFGEARLVEAAGNNLALEVGGVPHTLTHWSFGQLARTAGAPAHYLATLPAELAARCVETGLDRHFAGRPDLMSRQLLVHGNPDGRPPVVRSVTSDKYTRFWNHEVFARLMEMEADGWRVPPARPVNPADPNARPATAADVLRCQNGGGGIAVKVGDPIAPAGIYASDHDMFAFLVNEDTRLDDGSDGGLSRGFFVSNSEVGAAALKVTTFAYRHVCGNHIVWGAEDVLEIAVRHVGDVHGRFEVELGGKVKEYLAASGRQDEARIRRAKATVLGATDAEVLDAVFKAIAGKRRNGLPSGLSLKSLSAGLAMAHEYADVDGNPRSVWGAVNGLTRYSQLTPYAGDRAFLDRAAAAVLQLAV